MADLGDFGEEAGERESEEPFDRGMAVDTSDESDFVDRELVDPPGVSGLGTIAVSEGLAIGEEADDTHIRAYVTADNRREMRLGTYVIATYPDGEMLFLRVAGLEYAQEFQADDANEIHARRAMNADSIEERDYKFIADLAPVAVLFDHDGSLDRRMPDRIPRPETTVRPAADREEIKAGLNIPEEGIFVGHLAVGGERVRTAASPPTIDYRLNDDYGTGDPLVFRHTLVAGGTGSGKTHAAKNVLRQYLGRRYEMADGRTPELAVVQIDPQDEYAQMHDDNPALTPEDERDLERQGVAFGGHDHTVALVPEIEGARYPAEGHRAEWEPFTIPFSMVRGNPWLVAGGGLNYNQYNGLRELLDRFFKQDGENGTYQAFRSFMDDPTRREQLHEQGTVHEATFDAVKRRIQRFDAVFDQGTPPITELTHRLVRPGGLTTIPTYHISQSRAAETVVLAVSELLIEQKLSNDPEHQRIEETPVVLGMDEAHTFLHDADTVQGEQVIRRFSEAAKQGRKERLGLFLITQDPQEIADPIFKQVNTKVVLNLGDESAIDAVNVPRALESKIPYMPQGGMVVHSPDNSEPVELVGLPHCVVRHGRDD